jgi:hypothetical protein
MRRMVRLGTKPLSDTLSILEQVHDAAGRDSVQASLCCYLSDTSQSEDAANALLLQAMDKLRHCDALC